MRKACQVCGDIYTDAKLIEDFKNGVCFPCQSQVDHDKYIEDEKKELIRFNMKNGTDYDPQSFYYACDDGVFNKEDLNGFRLLKQTFNWNKELKGEIEQMDKREKERQSELFNNGLPF